MAEHEEDWEKWSAELADATAESIEEQERREAEARKVMQPDPQQAASRWRVT